MGKKKYLSLDDIIAVEDRGIVDEDVPEWGGIVRLRPLSGRDRGRLEAKMVSLQGGQIQANVFAGFREELVSMCLVDERGEPYPNRQAVVKAMAAKNSAVVDRLFVRCQKISGLSEEDVNDLVGNSEGGQKNGSGTS